MAVCEHNIFNWKGERRTLILLLLLYAGIFLVELLFYYLSGSPIVLAESLHVLSDSLIYVFALWSSFYSLKQQIYWSKVVGFLQIGMGVWVAANSLHHYIFALSSDHHAVIWVGLISLIANTISLFLVSEYREKTLYFTVSWIFLRNDFFIKFLVLCSGIAMGYWNPSKISLFSSLAIAAILMMSGKSILKQVAKKKKSLNKEA
ncbi:MAG: cation transporter [Bdellovibrionaceae bacterium]|nr:cation transporter [Pseudobdellovibrionaceae bacterium]